MQRAAKPEWGGAVTKTGGPLEKRSVRRVREALVGRGLSPEMVELEKTARSATEAADSLGVSVGQIVKSLVFKGARSGESVLVLASGPNRADEDLIAAVAGEPVEKADAAFVREKTGFAIGGVPPVGHAEAPCATVVDEDLLRHDTVWAAAGHTHVVFGLRPGELPMLTSGQVARIS